MAITRTTTTSTSMPTDDYIEGLLYWLKWNTSSDNEVPYCFPDATADYSDGGAPFGETASFSAFISKQETAAEEILAKYAEYVDLTFTDIGPTTGAVIRFGNSDVPGTAWAYPPSYSSSSARGATWYDAAGDDPDCGDYDYMTIIHEIGHALGLKHAHAATGLSEGTSNTVVVPADKDHIQWTAMSYRQSQGSGTGGYSNSQFPMTPMSLDIQALQYQYGPNTTIRPSGCVVHLNPTTNVVSIDGVPWLSPAIAEWCFLFPWCTGGDIELDLSDCTTDLTIPFEPMSACIVDSTKLIDLAGGNFADGNIYIPATHSSTGTASIPNRLRPGSGANHVIFSTQRSDNALMLDGNRADYSVVDEGGGDYTVTDERPGAPNGATLIENANFVNFADETVPVASLLNVTQIAITGPYA